MRREQEEEEGEETRDKPAIKSGGGAQRSNRQEARSLTWNVQQQTYANGLLGCVLHTKGHITELELTMVLK